jgi:hypothetical protein
MIDITCPAKAIDKIATKVGLLVQEVPSRYPQCLSGYPKTAKGKDRGNRCNQQRCKLDRMILKQMY